MSKSYSKSHQSERALKSHESKIRNRGGIIDTELDTGWGTKLKYHFPKKSK